MVYLKFFSKPEMENYGNYECLKQSNAHHQAIVDFGQHAKYYRIIRPNLIRPH